MRKMDDQDIEHLSMIMTLDDMGFDGSEAENRGNTENGEMKCFAVSCGVRL